MTDAVRAEALEPCPFCGARLIPVLGSSRFMAHDYEFPACVASSHVVNVDDPASVAIWNRRALTSQARLLEEATEALNRYRYAAAWAGADAWDFCHECQARFRWAREKDFIHLTDNEVAAVGALFLREASFSSLSQGEGDLDSLRADDGAAHPSSTS